MHLLWPALWLLGLWGCGPATPISTGLSRQCESWEIPHDGIDQDCIPDNEFDYDGDGYVAQYVRVGDRWVPGLGPASAYAWSQGLPLDLVGGDCDDFDAAVYPGAPGEVAYDAVDTNCDGSNDFDQDGDGWVPAGYAVEMEGYIQNALHGFVDFEVRVGDCDDNDPRLNPDRVDAPYDGVDMNCDGKNDYDLDGDGYIAQGYEEAYRFFVAVNGERYAVAGYADCEDLVDFVNPGAAERAATPRDEDCDGDGGSARLGVFDLVLYGATAADVAAGDSYQALVVGAEGSSEGDGPGLYALISALYAGADAPLYRVQATRSRPRGVAATSRLSGVQVTVLEDQRWAQVQLGSGAFGDPVVFPTGWVEGAAPGTQLVGGTDPFVCGEGPTVWLESGDIAPSASACGRLGEEPVLCSPDCVVLTDRGPEALPWSAPTRVDGGFALIDGRLYNADGSEDFSVSEADDAAAAHDYAAWIRDGQVWVDTPFGVVGPLTPGRAGVAANSEKPAPVEFYADEVHLVWVWGHVTVFAVEHRGTATRVALARFDP